MIKKQSTKRLETSFFSSFYNVLYFQIIPFQNIPSWKPCVASFIYEKGNAMISSGPSGLFYECCLRFITQGHIHRDDCEVTWHALSLNLIKMVDESHGQDGSKSHGSYLLQSRSSLLAKMVASQWYSKVNPSETYHFPKPEFNSSYTDGTL